MIKVGDFRKILREWFTIEVNDQILIKNGEQVTRQLGTPFKSLQITSQTTFMLVARQKPRPQPKRNEQKEMEVREILGILNESLQRAREREKHRQQLLKIKKKHIYSLQGKTVDIIIATFIKSLHLPNSELLLTNQPKLKFILQKISAGNSQLHKILLHRIKAVKLALIDQSFLQKNTKRHKSTIIKEQLDDLVKHGYPHQQAVKALEISKNDLQAALQLLYNREIDDQSQSSEPSIKMNAVKQYLFIFAWLSQQQHSDIILLNNCPQFMEVYLNSLKHTQPHIFQLMLRWKHFICRMVKHLYSQIQIKMKMRK